MATSRLASVLLFLVLASSGGTQEARAQRVGGTGQLAGRFVLRVQRCGRERGPVSLLDARRTRARFAFRYLVGGTTGATTVGAKYKLDAHGRWRAG